MATSSALVKASKFLNLSSPSLQNLIRRNLVHPSAAAAHLFQSTASTAAVPDAYLVNPSRLANGNPHSLYQSLLATNLNVDESNFPLYFRGSTCYSAPQGEAAPRYVPSSDDDEDSYRDSSDDAYGNDLADDEEEDDDLDSDDDEEDEGEEEEEEEEVEEEVVRPRGYRK